MRTGTLTFVLADLEGSTRLAQRVGEARFPQLIDAYRTLLSETFAGHGGEVQSRADEVLGVFDRAPDAVAAALEAQRRVLSHEWPDGVRVRARMGIHAGDADLDGGEFTGLALHRTARICSAGHGGQVLLSRAVTELLPTTPQGCSMLDLGVHVLRDLEQPEHLAQLCHADLPSDFPPLRGGGSQQSSVPRSLTSLLGRDMEVQAVTDLLHDEPIRLVSVTGPAGVGKTRLALELSERVADQFVDGVVFVGLAVLTRADLVVSAVANALGIREAGSVDLAGIVQLLGHRELLLVLDNFEHVVSAAGIVPQLLRSCPGVKVLVTSRGPLRVTGEHVFDLRPLGVPAAGNTVDARSLTSAPAAALFVERASLSRPDYDAAQDPEAVAALCRRLDGIPLAIELAAASVRLLTPREMVRRLEAGLHALPVAQRDVPRRHESVVQAIDWSYSLLSAPEQDLFRRLSTFSGGCSLDAAEQVAAADVDFLARLDGVASQSLVRVDTDDGDVRLSMLQTIAEFGRQRLSEAGDAQKVQHALATYFLTLAERERRAISTADQAWALRRLEREHGNLRSALEHLMAEGSADEACRMAAALAPFWRDHGHLDEGRRWLDEALRRATDADPDIRMGVVLGVALVAYEDDRVDDAGAMAHTALAYFAATGDARRVIEAREVLAAIDRFHGEHLQSITQYDEALELARGLEDRWLVAHLLDRRGIAAWAAGDYEAAESSLSAALTRFRELGDEQGEAFALWQLGSVDAVAGRIRLGLRRMEQAVPVLRRGRHRRQLARALWNIGVASVRIGQPDRAEEALVEATRMFREVKFGRHMAAMLLAFAELAAFRGNHEQAARLLGATSAEWDRWLWTPSAPMVELWEECAARVRANLGPDGFAAASSDGRALSLEEAMHDAVRSDPNVPTGLSAREIDVLELVADGLSNADIAERLYVSVRTVHAHLRSAYTKLGVGSRTAAVRRASELGVVSATAAR